MSLENVNELYGGPTKRFFVSMITRDIDLDDAIMDLIDNSVDGAMRQTQTRRMAKKPYAGFRVRLTLSGNQFNLIDNCGGIPDDRIAAAFRLGRPQTELDQDIPTIGMYGIGMKRAIFKMGKEATVESSSEDGVRRVSYTKEWLDDASDQADKLWELPIKRSAPRSERGIKIEIPALRQETARYFSSDALIEELKKKIAVHFGYILQKGFEIYVNKESVEPDTLKLYTSEGITDGINPFDYLAKLDSVVLRIVIGFNRRLPRPEEIEDEEDAPRTRDRAGISVICNDRVILHNDTTFRTSWGDRTVPKFHNQFMAIGGVISFLSNDANALPVSTTKTGIEMESEVYNHALNVCATGLKLFTTFTNKWKGRVKDTSKYFDVATRRDALSAIDLAATKGRKVADAEGSQYKPDLPLPPKVVSERTITFRRPVREIERVSNFLFNEVRHPSEVGEECFRRCLTKAKG